MRSATSWLNEQLRRHPGLWLPPVKELHYFDTKNGKTGGLPRRWRKDLPRIFRNAWKKKRLPGPWECRFLFCPETDGWYQSLFTEGDRAGKMTGEITPAYALLPVETIRRIHAMNPDLKILFILRDPIDRTWSSAVRSLCRERQRSVGDVADSEFVSKFASTQTNLKSRYTTTMERWESVFPRAQFFYGFFEDIRNDPVEFMERVFTFLGADASQARALVTPEARNQAASGTPIPAHFESLLAREYLGETAALARRFGGHAEAWHNRCRRLAPGLS